MAYQTIAAKNERMRCGILIECFSTGTPADNVDSIVLKKRMVGKLAWKDIATIDILTEDDFNFSCFDVETRSGSAYEYMAVPIIDGIEQPGVGATCTCEFDGIYIADDTGTWISLYNYEYSMHKNTQVSHIVPLSGKYPKRISNADTNYMSGNVTGLFLPFDGCGHPDTAHAREYKDSLLEMLADGKSKLLKTYDGNAWIVSIDAEPKEDYSKFTGASTITFEWTQIGEVESPPVTHMPLNSDGISFTIASDGMAHFKPDVQSM